MSYLQRTVPPDSLRAAAERFDCCIKSILHLRFELTDIPEVMTSAFQQQLSWPLKSGGFALPEITDLMTIAYVSSIAHS